jgi:hypothetical protein
MGLEWLRNVPINPKYLIGRGGFYFSDEHFGREIIRPGEGILLKGLSLHLVRVAVKSALLILFAEPLRSVMSLRRAGNKIARMQKCLVYKFSVRSWNPGISLARSRRACTVLVFMGSSLSEPMDLLLFGVILRALNS